MQRVLERQNAARDYEGQENLEDSGRLPSLRLVVVLVSSLLTYSTTNSDLE